MELGAVVTFTCTCTRTWCYTTRNFDMHLCTYLMLRYKWGGVGWTGGWEILLVLPTYLMLREGMFTYTCTRTLCFIANGVWAGQVIEKRLSCSLRRRMKASESDTTKHLHSQGWQNSSIAWTSCQTAVETQEQWSLEAREKSAGCRLQVVARCETFEATKVYIYTSIHLYIYTDIHIYIYTHIDTFTPIYIYIYAFIHILYTCIYIHMYTYRHRDIYTCIHICVYI